jgi:hypothetical protein
MEGSPGKVLWKGSRGVVPLEFSPVGGSLECLGGDALRGPAGRSRVGVPGGYQGECPLSWVLVEMLIGCAREECAGMGMVWAWLLLVTGLPGMFWAVHGLRRAWAGSYGLGLTRTAHGEGAWLGCSWYGLCWACGWLTLGCVGMRLSVRDLVWVLPGHVMGIGCAVYRLAWAWAGQCMACPGHGFSWACAGLGRAWAGHCLSCSWAGLGMNWLGHGFSIDWAWPGLVWPGHGLSMCMSMGWA